MNEDPDQQELRLKKAQIYMDKLMRDEILEEITKSCLMAGISHEYISDIVDLPDERIMKINREVELLLQGEKREKEINENWEIEQEERETQQRVEEIARRLLSMGMEMDFVARTTDLRRDRIMELYYEM
ncbi:hypothetical protein ACW2QC_19685 [Virgibacillus sp. FSP13]